MHLDRKRAALVRRARDLEGEKVLLHLQIAELTREKEASTKNQDSLQQRLKTMVTLPTQKYENTNTDENVTKPYNNNKNIQKTWRNN